MWEEQVLMVQIDNMKKVIVLAGGNDQIELIKGLRKRFDNVEIILIDFAKNIRASKYADKHLLVSTMDKEAVLNVAQQENVDLILTACGDQPLTTMAYVSEKLGLNCYLTYEQSLKLTNKLFMKDLMVKHDIPTSKYKIINSVSDFDLSGLKFPLVIKPVDNNGSKGITKVHNEQEVKEAILDAQKYTLGGGMIIEEFKEGEEYSIEAFIYEGMPKIVMATKNIKIKDNNNRFTILLNSYINNLSEIIKKKILSIIAEIGKTFKINNVPLLIQLIVKEEDISVIEFSARTGGGSKLHFIREMVHVDIIDNLIDITIGKLPVINTKPSKQEAAICYLYTTPGVFSKISNLETLKQEKVVFDCFYYKTIGTKISASQFSSDRPAGFFVKAESQNELYDKISFIDKNIKILNEKGEDIMIHGLYDKIRN